jgi:hypothetical protein
MIGDNLVKSPPREGLAVGAILMCGALARLVWTSNGDQLRAVTTESHGIAVSLARIGRFADPFINGGGSTAHIGMLTPLPSAIAYWLFGVDTPLAEFALSIWAICVLSVGFWLAWRLSCVLDVPRFARMAGLAFVALVPLQFGLEVREGRSWEVNLAVVLLLWVLLRLAMADRRGTTGARDLAMTGAICGLLFIVSPPAGLAAVPAIGLFQLLRLPRAQWWIAPAAFAIVAGVLGGFWAERNLIQLGEPIALRDNFGLELDISNYSEAVDPGDPHAAYLARVREIHPLNIGPGADKLRAAGGEVPYYRKLGREAEDWIVTHPRDFLYLSTQHFAQFYLPPKWFWATFGTFPGRFIWLRQLLAWAAAIAGVCTAVAMSYRRRAYAYVLIAILGCSATYILIQPTLRYRYLVSSLLIFLACDGAARVAKRIHNRRPHVAVTLEEPVSP